MVERHKPAAVRYRPLSIPKTVTVEERRVSTGALTWISVAEDRPAYWKYNVVEVGYPPGRAGPAFVIRYVGQGKERKYYYLFRTFHDDQNQYLSCTREKIEKLRQYAEGYFSKETQAPSLYPIRRELPEAKKLGFF